MLTCKDASKLISEAQDRKLGLRERIGLRLHLWMCKSCRLFEKQLCQLRQALQKGCIQGELPTEITLSTEARERIRQTLNKQSGI
jgi:hypothetical protein